jgi:uncharacterized coiled-coil DUF342 family protein
MNEEELRRHLDEAHRQLLERDTAFRFSEERIENLRTQLNETEARARELEAWARQLEAALEEMQATRAWRFAERLRSLRLVRR